MGCLSKGSTSTESQLRALPVSILDNGGSRCATAVGHVKHWFNGARCTDIEPEADFDVLVLTPF